MTPKEMAMRMMENGTDRKEAEKMMGKKFENMTQPERRMAATVFAAFYGLKKNISESY